MSGKYMAYVGSYSYTGKAKGITVFDVDVENGMFKERCEIEVDNSSYVIASSDGKTLYSIADEGVVSFRILPNGSLARLNSAPIRGMRGCHLCTDEEDKYVFVSGYHDGKTTVLSLNPDGSVGKIVDRCQVRIVDGEIQVKSPSVMMGYYKEPDKTAEAITEDGWLCTGDLGYVDEENFLYLTGRKKNLIILSNGENVAPEQLENLFVDDRLIEDILVYGEDDMIAAEIYPNFKYADAAGIDHIEETVAQIIKKHNEGLPSYKKIARFHLRDIPFAKTSSKKIIRSQYFSQKKQEAEEQVNVHKPENDLQQKIYDAVSAVLGHSRFGIDTDLYSAGLDSLGSVLLLTATSPTSLPNSNV